MASKIREVLEIEAANSYIKKPAWPMIMIELKDISKLSGSKPWKGVTPPTGLLSTNVPDGKQSKGGAPQPKQDQGGRPSRPQKARSTQTCTWRNPVNSEALRQLEHPTDPTIDNCSDKLLRADSQPRSSSQAGAPRSSEANQVMTEQASVPELMPDSPSQMLSKHLENFHMTKAKLNFGFRNADSSQATQPATSTNPFAALEADNPEAEDTMDNPEEMREGWTFQGRKKHTPKIGSLR
ncbi:unnamed protein product [Sphagnum tenellum]